MRTSLLLLAWVSSVGTAVAEPAIAPPSSVQPIATESSMSNLEIAGIGTALLGGAAIGVGFVFNHHANAISQDIAGQPPGQPWRDDIRDYAAKGERAENRATALWIGGGAAVVTGAILWATGRHRRSERVTIVPVMTQDTAGVSISGGF